MRDKGKDDLKSKSKIKSKTILVISHSSATGL
jgi:hypothetical protein